MCGYDFNRLGRSRILKDGHWDILTTDKKTSQPKYIHDEKRHPDFKNVKNTKTQPMKTQRKATTYQNKKEKKKSKKGKWAVIVFILYLLSFLADLVPGQRTDRSGRKMVRRGLQCSGSAQQRRRTGATLRRYNRSAN